MTRLPTPRRRGRPRDDAASPAILQATLDEVAEVGLAGLTVEAVAARAGVGKATIYRRWSSKEALMLDAWVSCTPDKAVPHTGSLRGDLLALFSHVEAGLTTGMMQRIFPQMIAAAKVNPGVADAYRSFIAQRRRPLRTVLERAVDNGELPSTTNVEMVQDLLVAPVLFRWLVSDAEAGAEFVAGVIDLVLTGAGARETVG